MQQRRTHQPTPCGYNRLIEVRDANNTLIAAYSYDPFGRRISKDAGTSKTFYLYSDEGLIVEADASGQVTKSYGYAPQSDYGTQPLFMRTGNNYYYYQLDHLGTPQQLTSQSGQVVWRASYDAYGNATVDPGSSITNNLRFPGQYFDAETGLHYNWMRYYEPATGRYVASDPVSLYAGVNLYAYAFGNPANIYDPYGLFGMADMPMFPQGVVDAVAGFGDTLSFGATSLIRGWMGTNGAVNKCSREYGYGELGGIGLSLAFGGAHLGRNALNQIGKSGTLQTGIGRLFSDSRAWSTVRNMWSRSAGNGAAWLAKNGQSLHHWLITQRTGRAYSFLSNVVNAGFNYMPISAKFNSWMNGSTGFRTAVEYGFTGSVLGIYGAIPTAIYNQCDCTQH